MNMIEEIFSYVKKKYGVEPDYPFSTAPDYPVLRHEDNRKWFAIIMDAPGDKLGLEDTDRVDVINVKMNIFMIHHLHAERTRKRKMALISQNLLHEKIMHNVSPTIGIFILTKFLTFKIFMLIENISYKPSYLPFNKTKTSSEEYSNPIFSLFLH